MCSKFELQNTFLGALYTSVLYKCPPQKKLHVLWLFSDLLGERLAVVSASHRQLVWWIQMKKLVSNAIIYQKNNNKKDLAAQRPGAGTRDMKRWFLRRFIKIWENPRLKLRNLAFPSLGLLREGQGFDQIWGASGSRASNNNRTCSVFRLWQE